MSISTYPDAAVKRLAAVFRALGEPNRLRILCSLGLECRPVSDVIRATGLEQTNVSFHLRALREAGLVRPERRGPFVYYCLQDAQLLNIVASLHEYLDAVGQAKASHSGRTTMRSRRGTRSAA